MPERSHYLIRCRGRHEDLERGSIPRGRGMTVKLALNMRAAHLRHAEAKPACAKALVESVETTAGEHGRA